MYYIHSNGVCHNDMKPENIIVGVTRARYGGDGNPDDMEGVGGGVGIEGESGNFQKSELCLKVSVKIFFSSFFFSLFLSSFFLSSLFLSSLFLSSAFFLNVVDT